MADQKISELTALTGANAADDDVLAIVDTSAVETKKITRSELFTDTPTILVGTTDSTLYNNSGSGTGVNLQNFGNIAVARDGNDCMVLNRLNSDGDIALFNKDGATVGSIGTANGVPYFYGSSGFRLGGSIQPINSAGALSDNTTDIGQSNARFKDLYLSGGVYLGGTVAANHLDDYEEGTWTPVYRGSTTAGTATVGSTEGFYTKIGNSVTIWLRIANMTISGAAGATTITGLPFTSSHGSAAYSSVAMAMTHNIDFGADWNQSLYVAGNTLYGLESRNGDTWVDWAVTNSTGIYINFTMTYRTA